MDVGPDEEVVKVRVVGPKASRNTHNVTLQVVDEDHTLGNSLRYVLAKNRAVDFAGYSIPHPSEPYMNIRVQTVPAEAGETGALGAVKKAAEDLVEIYKTIELAFDASLDPMEE